MVGPTILLFAAFATFLFSGPAAAAQASGPDIRGVITRVDPEEADSPDGLLVGTIFIEGQKEPDTQVDRASVRVSGETRIFETRDGERFKVSFDALKVGQRVEVRFAGPVLLSYPVQAGASEIVIREE